MTHHRIPPPGQVIDLSPPDTDTTPSTVRDARTADTDSADETPDSIDRDASPRPVPPTPTDPDAGGDTTDSAPDVDSPDTRRPGPSAPNIDAPAPGSRDTPDSPPRTTGPRYQTGPTPITDPPTGDDSLPPWRTTPTPPPAPPPAPAPAQVPGDGAEQPGSQAAEIGAAVAAAVADALKPASEPDPPQGPSALRRAARRIRLWLLRWYVIASAAAVSLPLLPERRSIATGWVSVLRSIRTENGIGGAYFAAGAVLAFAMLATVAHAKGTGRCWWGLPLLITAAIGVLGVIHPWDLIEATTGVTLP